MNAKRITTLLGGLALAIALPGAAVAAERDTLVAQGKTEAGRTDKNAEFATQQSDKAIVSGGFDRSQRKGGSATNASVNQEFWIYDAYTVLRDDFDGDGFFTRLELTLDADTVFEGANVYAVLYLSLEGGDWIEYGETNVFDIYGTSGSDEYYFDSDLVSGFPTGYYDVLIELYDDFDQRLVAVFGPEQSLELYDLPLESQTTDSIQDPIIIVTDEGGGSFGIGLGSALLSMLIARVLLRRKRLRVTNELSVVTR